MKCEITGRTGYHVPFNVIDYTLYHDGEKEIFDWIWPGYKYYEKMIDTINDINIYMENEYKRDDDDIIVLYGKQKNPKMPYFVSGAMYIFSDTNIDISKIRGEIFIIPIWYRNMDILHFFYIFRTIIRTPFEICPVSRESLSFYNEFCKELDDDIKELKLARSEKLYEESTRYFMRRSYSQYEPKDVCLHPIIFEYTENLDLQSFDNFMTRIEVIAKKYSLQAIGRRCRDFGKPIK